MAFSNSARLVKGGIVLVDPDTAKVQRVIAFQYNPEKLSRSFKVKRVGEGAEQSDVLRLTGPAVETFKLEAEIDAADQLEFPERNRAAVESGVAPQLAVLESLVNPTVEALRSRQRLASQGTLEIAPMESALPIFVWGANRIAPVVVEDFSIEEEAYGPALLPYRAKVSLGLRVLSVDDVGFEHKGGVLFMAYLQVREKLAGRSATFGFETLGIGGLP
jgi:hypothetical protein